MFREGYASKILADVYAAIHADKLNSEQNGQETEDNKQDNQNKNGEEDQTRGETDV